MDQMVSEERAVSMKSPDSGAGPLDFGRDKPSLTRVTEQTKFVFSRAAASVAYQRKSPGKSEMSGKNFRVLTGGVGHAWRNAIALCDACWTDVRHSFRALRRSPGFSLVVTVTLALTIGANTAS